MTTRKTFRAAALLLALCLLLGCFGGLAAGAESNVPGAAKYRATLNYAYNITVNDLGLCHAYQITLSGEDGAGNVLGAVNAFCADHGLHCTSGTYYAQSGTLNDTEIARVLTWYDRMKSSDSLAACLFAQIYIWSYQKGSDIRSNVMAAWREYYGAGYVQQASDWYDDVQRVDASGSVVTVWSCGKAGYQRLFTVTTTPYEDMRRSYATASTTAPEQVTISLAKTDADTGSAISGCAFDLYRDDVKLTTLTTDAGGQASYVYSAAYTADSDRFWYVENYANISPAQQAEADRLGYYHSYAAALAAAQADAQAKANALAAQNHTYKVVETASHASYVLDSTAHTHVVTGSGSYTFGITNAPKQPEYAEVSAHASTEQNVKIKVVKTDAENGKPIADAVFDLYRDGVKADTITTGYDGTADYVVTTTYTDSKTYTYCANYDMLTAEQKAIVVAGGYYTSRADAYYAAKAAAEAKAAADANTQHAYSVMETKTGAEYVLDATEHSATVTGSGETTLNVTNAPKKFRVTLFKADTETGYAQGDATLEGAVYGIYRNGQLVDTYQTAADGSFTTDYYRCAVDSTADVWTVQEITPAPGYLLDSAVYPIDTAVDNITVELTDRTVNSAEQIIKGNVSIIKHADDGSTQIETPEAGAAFQLYLTAAGSFDAAAETERDTLTCDEYGYAESKPLPYGTYTVHQVSGWDGTTLLPDFTVRISEDGKTYRYLINNATFASYIKVVKTDAETGSVIPCAGAAFQIYRPDGSLVSMSYTYPTVTTIDTFYTSADGTLVTPESLPYGSGYTLVEVAAPQGYVLDSTPVAFDVTADAAADEGGHTVVLVNKANMPQKGVIRVAKTGEVFASVTDADGVYQPQYAEAGLAGAVYTITAAEDIITPDGTVRAAAGTVVDTITTGADGTAASKELYLGKYTVTETKAPAGYTLNGESHAVELTYAGQSVAVTETGTAYHNDRQKVAISLSKTMEQDELFGLGANGESESVRFGLFAAEALTAADGSSIPADGLIEQVSVSADGTAAFAADLPLGSYYVQELATDNHYILDGTKYPVIFAYARQDTATVELNVNDGTVIENKLIRGKVAGRKVDGEGNGLAGAVFGLFGLEQTELTADTALLTATADETGSFAFTDLPYGSYLVQELSVPDGYTLDLDAHYVTVSENEQIIDLTVTDYITTIEISKVDATTGEELPGASLTVTDSTGSVVDEWVSGNTPHTITGLTVGQTYTLTETLAPDGYATAESVTFTISNTGEVQKVEMKDELTTIALHKTDLTTGEELPGAHLTVTDSTGKVVDEWVSTDTPHTISGLTVGQTYTLTETLAPDGYATAENITFTIEDTASVQRVEMKDELTTTEISKVDAATGEELPGAHLTVTDNTGKVVDEWVSTDTPHIITGLTVGESYTLTETLAPDGYVTAESITFTIEDNASVQRVKMQDDQTKVEIRKYAAGTDGTIWGTILHWLAGDQQLPGAHLAVLDSAGNVVEQWVTDGRAHTVRGLIVGETYTLHEYLAPDGYACTADISFTVADSAETLTLKMYDDTTKVEIYKTDIATGAELPGAHMTVTDDIGNVVDEWVSGDTPHTIAGLTAGQTYTLTEISAPAGYDVAEAVKFEVKDTGEVQKVEMQDAPAPTSVPAAPKTGDTAGTVLRWLTLALAATSLIFVACWRKNQRK